MNAKKNGRPKLCSDQETPLENYAARLSFKQARLVRKLGGGNFSEGLRAALDKVAEDLDWINERSKK